MCLINLNKNKLEKKWHKREKIMKKRRWSKPKSWAQFHALKRVKNKRRGIATHGIRTHNVKATVEPLIHWAKASHLFSGGSF